MYGTVAEHYQGNVTRLMAETTMPATEAEALLVADERDSYECAFHILPTVAEGEVPGVFEELKGLITKTGGELFDEEAPERIDLAYEIVRKIDSKNRKFGSAYFGWVRFRLPAEKLEQLVEELDAYPSLLRYLLLKLSKLEEANPVQFHENRKSVKMVQTVDEGAEVLVEQQTEKEENVEVSDAELEESLEKITGEDSDSDGEKA